MKTIFAAIILLVAAFGYGAEAEADLTNTGLYCNLGLGGKPRVYYACTQEVISIEYDSEAQMCVVTNDLHETKCSVDLPQSQCDISKLVIEEYPLSSEQCQIYTRT